MLNPHINKLAKLCATIPDTELKLIVIAIHQYIESSELPKGSIFRRLVEAYNAKYDIPMDFRMVEHAVLLEAARRYVNKED
jgi:hypothetical protein